MENNYEKYKQNLGTVWIINEEDNIEFYEIHDNPTYWISKCGKVYNAEPDKDFMLKPTIIQSGKGYYTVTINKKRTRLHRLLAITFLNNSNNYPVVDHINGNTLDNSLENLRWCTISMNARNQTKNKNKSSKYMGVTKTKNTWCAQCLGKRIGTFATEIEAAEAYNAYATKHGILHLNKINND